MKILDNNHDIIELFINHGADSNLRNQTVQRFPDLLEIGLQYRSVIQGRLMPATMPISQPLPLPVPFSRTTPIQTHTPQVCIHSEVSHDTQLSDEMNAVSVLMSFKNADLF